MQSLLETYGIPSSLSHDVPNLVYPNNVGEIRVSVPEGLGDEALRILAAHQGGIASSPIAPLAPAPSHDDAARELLAGQPAGEVEEEEEDEDDDEDEWDDDDDDEEVDSDEDDVPDDEEDDEEDDEDDDDDIFDDEE